jgi:hypothetical protein
MTYGHGNPNWHPEAATVEILIADNDGKLIRHNSLPAGYNPVTLHALNDNSFLLAAYSQTQSTMLHIFHFNNDGSQISHDSVQISNAAYTGNICSTQEGKIFVGYQDVNLNFFISEIDIKGNIIWTKQTTNWFYCAMLTNDGGYLYNYMGADSGFYIQKTNANGDSIWQKKFITRSGVFCTLMAASGSNYRLGLYPDPNASYITEDPYSVYEINQSGDSIKSTEISDDRFNIPQAMLESSDENTFILNYSYTGGWVSPAKTNTHYVFLDSDLKITKRGAFQSFSNDKIGSAVKTSDGKIACFGLVQSFGKTSYKPCLIILN